MKWRKFSLYLFSFSLNLVYNFFNLLIYKWLQIGDLNIVTVHYLKAIQVINPVDYQAHINESAGEIFFMSSFHLAFCRFW